MAYEENVSIIQMRAVCTGGCKDHATGKGWTQGESKSVAGQNTVRCTLCRKWQYNAPKSETGEEQRHIKTRDNIKAATRARILTRANGLCELCGVSSKISILHVSHILSVDDSHCTDITPEEVNHDDNLASLCEACNLGMGKLSFNPRLYLRLLRRRIEL